MNKSYITLDDNANLAYIGFTSVPTQLGCVGAIKPMIAAVTIGVWAQAYPGVSAVSNKTNNGCLW